jgi:predicted acetyltransferase
VEEIRELSKGDLDRYVDIVVNAYPGMRIFTAEGKDRLRMRFLRNLEEEPGVTVYGVFRDGKLLGGFRMHDFQMNLLGTQTWIGGLGFVAVDLVHKKEHLARNIVRFFLRHFRGRGIPFACLYAFRPDFYRAMGFGYGSKKSRYRFRTEELPDSRKCRQVRFLDEGDHGAMVACHNRIQSRTHGMMVRTEFELRDMLTDPGTHAVGYAEGNTVRGYLVFTFEPGGNFFQNDLHIHEFLAEDREAREGLIAFLRTQLDQVRYVIYDTHDESFQHVLRDPRDGARAMIHPIHHQTNVQGVGLLYRVVNVAGVFEALKGHNFGGQTCTVEFAVRDSLLPENQGSTIVHFEEGTVDGCGREPAEVRVSIPASELSSLVVGSVRFRYLYEQGLADVSEVTRVGMLDTMFATETSPVCTTSF